MFKELEIMKTNILTNIRVWAIMMACLTVLGVGNAWGAVVSGTTYNTNSGNTPTGWTISGGTGTGASYIGLTYDDKYIQTDEFCVSSFSSITLSARKYGGPSAAEALITVSWWVGGVETVLGTVAPTGTSLSDYTISSPASVSANSEGYVKISCKSSASGRGSGVGAVTITYTAGTPTPHTVTFNAEGGTCGTSSLTGTSVTLPAATGCPSEGWEFYGWATARCASSTPTAPTIVGKAGDTYKPAADIELHAVYATGEYTRETSAITAGGKYLIVANSGGNNYVMTNNYSTSGDNGQLAGALINETSTNKYHAANIPSNYVFTIVTSGSVGVSSGTWMIKNITDNKYISADYEDFYITNISNADGNTIALSTNTWTITNVYSSNTYKVYYNSSTNVFCSTTSDATSLLIYKETTTPAYWSNPPCCSNKVAVSYNSAGSTHVSAMTFSADNVATCGGASTRRVTVFVTPTSGYLFKAGDELTWTKSSGTIPADPTLVSGPTLNAGKYEFVYEFAQNDNGAGTFAAAASTLTNYRTTCCTELGSIGGSVAFTNPTTAVVSWSDLDHVSSWTVKYKTHAAGVWNTAGASSASAGTRSVTISSLTCNTDYDFQIIATPASGYCDALQTIENQNSGTWTVTSTGVTNVTPASSIPSTTCDGFSIASMSPASGYHLPTSITVTNADHTWNSTTGALTISNVTGNVTITITGEENSCDAYSFHTGGSDVWNTRAENKCFVQDGSTKRWYISNYTITSNTHFCLNWQGGKYDRGGDNNVRFMTQPWTEMSLAYGRSGKVGVATGAVGTIQMYANSSDDNLYVGFIPDGYVLKYNGVNEVMTQSSTYVWYAPTPYTINSTTQGYTVAVGLNDGSDNYVACDNTAAVKHIFVKVDHSDWTAAAAKYELYNIQTSSFVGEYMRAVPGETNLYEGWIPSGCTSIIIARCNPGADMPTGNTWTNVWNQSQNITLDGSKNYYTINSKDGSNKYYGAWSVYEKSGKWYLDLDGTTTGGQKNFSCYFYPHYVLHYDANSGSGAPADQSVALDASPCQLTVSSTVPTRAGYTFLGWNQSSSATTPDGDWDGGDTHAMTADVTLYAVWAANHTLSYNYNGGDGSSCTGGTKYTGESFTACASAGSKTGYTFNNWLGSNSVSYTAGSNYTMPDADLTLTAQWKPDVYNITYKDQGDVAYSGDKTDGRPTGNPATHTYGSASALVDGVKAGYRFDGWYTNSTCTEGPVTSLGATAYTSAITLYAKWTQVWTISWKIWNDAESRYDEYAGDGTHTTEVVAGGTISKIPTNPADNALSSCASKFMGWSETALGSDLGQSAPGDLFTTTPVGSITADKTYYAVYATQSGSAIGFPINMTYNSHSYVSISAGNLNESDTKGFYVTRQSSGFYWLFTIPVSNIESGSVVGITLGDVSVSNNSYKFTYQMSYSFGSGYTNVGSTFTENTAAADESQSFVVPSNIASGNIYIKWLSTSGGGSNGGNHYIKTVVITCTPPAHDYVTSCCSTAAVTNGAYSNVTGSGSTMSAKVTWDDAANTNRYRVVCEALSIDAISTNKYYTTSSVMTSCTDYTFNVYAAPEGGCQSAPLAITVSPVEAAKTVTFNYNGSGQATGSFTTDCTHSSTNLPTPDAYAGHRFDGWYDDASSGSKIGNAGASYAPTATITLYAHWIAVANLTYSGDATGTCTGTTSKDVGTTITACTPSSRDHYTFDYWVRSDNSAHVNAGATFTMPGSDLTLTAHWTADSYNITYKDQGDVAYSGSNSGSLPSSHSYGTETVLVNGVKSGYRFDGWFTTSACTGDPITSLGATAYTSAIILYAKWTASYTFTFSKNGVVDDALTVGQITGENVIMPNTTVDCGLWTTFEGWVESTVAETTTEPAVIYKPGDIFVAGTSNKEFKALYSKHEGDATVSYVKVSSNSVTPSGEYVIACPEGNTILTGLNGNARGTYEAVTISDNVISNKGNGVVLNITKKGSTFNIKMSGDTKYITDCNETYFGYSVTNAASACKWELTSEGYIHSTDYTTRYIEFLKSGTQYFGSYTGTQWKTFLYRKKVAGTTYYTTAPGSCDVPTEITVSYNDNKSHAGDQTISGMPSGTTLTFTSYPDFASYTVGSAPTDPTGYHFVGWNTQADGNGDDYTAGSSVTTFGYRETITLYAKWERVYTVTLYDNGSLRTTLTQASAGANVTLPSGNNCTPGSAFTFVGWTDSPVQLNAEPVRPNIVSGAGEWGDDELTDDITLYSVYSKSVTGCDDFAAGVSGAYKLTDKASGEYALAAGGTSSSFARGSSGDAEIFYIGYSPAKSAYTIRTSTGYLGWFGASGSEALTKGNTTPYYWNITAGTGANSGYWYFEPVGISGKQFSGNSGSKFQVHGNSTKYYIQLTKIAMTYYYNTAICGDAKITFHDGGGTISGTPTTPTGASWNSGTHVLSGLEDCDKITTFPTASYDGWTFVGWSTEDYTNCGKHTAGTSQYAEENASTEEPDASNIYKTDGNPYVVRGGSIDLYPIFTRFPDNEPFDIESGGRYYMYYLDPDVDDGFGAPARRYAGAWDGTKRYTATTSCAEATEFEFTKSGDVWHIQNVDNNKWLGGKSNDDWLIENNSLGTLTDWTITIRSGNQFNATCQSGRQISVYQNFFMDYSSNNLVNNTGYYCVYLGSCEERIFSSEPHPTPTIDLIGEPYVTSSAGQMVRAAATFTLSASHLASVPANKIIVSGGDKLKFTTNPAEDANPTSTLSLALTDGSLAATTIYVYYTPAVGDTEDGLENIIVTAKAYYTTTPKDPQMTGTVHARHLPANFVIAAKLGDKWYALPADGSSTIGAQIEVDDVNDPAEATAAPNTVKYGLRKAAERTRKAGYGERLVFTERLSTATADNQVTLYNGSGTSVSLYTQYTSYFNQTTESVREKHEWIPVTSDFKDYQLTSASESRDLCLGNDGVFGALTMNKAYDGKVRLLPATFYEEAPVQILEWKASSVVVMYTGAETSATTQIEGNSPTSTQTLASQKLTHGIYELTTSASIGKGSNSCKNLTLAFGSTKKVFEIPVILTGSVTTFSGYDNKDIIIPNGKKLTASTSTKYNYRNIYVYGGGKLEIPANGKLGVNNIILRAGGISTNGSGGSATYEYVYPQIKLASTEGFSSTKTNIKYEYITDYDHWYHFCLPFNGTLSSITYPTEYYGNNVTEGNSGSWIVKRYDGATRATGNYNAWVDIESESATEVIAGKGYIFWGAPKKVSVGGAAKVRQQWGIQRITMPIAAAAAVTAETNDKNISVDSYSEVATSTKPNDQGWNLVGNPFMANLTGLTSESLIAGKLVHTDTDPWDGKWKNNGDGTRYVTIPDNHFDNYVAKTTATASGAGDFMPGRTFFVQIAEGATTLTFATANRASLMPALFAQTEVSTDIETGIVMSDETHHDEVNFWIKDGKTEAYESNADYPKTPNGSNFNIYGVHEACDLSWIAISPAIAEGSMAIGYQVPTAGEYTLSLSETYVSDKIDHVFVTDHAMSPEITTDLMDGVYNFQVNQAETNNTRFTVSIKLKEESPGTATGVDDIRGDSDKPTKFIYHDKMYILRGGVIYDATGKKVQEINK